MNHERGKPTTGGTEILYIIISTIYLVNLRKDKNETLPTSSYIPYTDMHKVH
jgi:hypothetical protein